jgi:Transposase, Mutator family
LARVLRSLVKRGLVGVQLAISDAHPALKASLAQVLGCPWQRCTVYFLRDCLGHARKDQHGLLAALIRPIFRAESGEEARRRQGEAVSQLERPLPKVTAMLEEAEKDILAFYAFPSEHWPKLRSTNPLERLHQSQPEEEVVELAAACDAIPITDEMSADFFRMKVKFGGRLGSEVGASWLVRATDVAKCRRQELMACRAALPFEGLKMGAPLSRPHHRFGCGAASC